MKLDILIFAAHPDDAELACSGTILKHLSMGKSIGIVDLTRGELGTRGSAEIRDEESKNATKVLGIKVRENLQFRDGFFVIDEAHKLKIIEIVRKYRPKIVLCNAVSDRHPDHSRASKLVSESCFLAGLIKVETFFEGNIQNAWRPKFVYHYIQDRYIKPDFVVDISQFIDKKIEAIKAFKSQFYDPNSTEPITPIASEGFLEFVKGRAKEFGRNIGVEYGEGFTVERTIGVNNLGDLV